MAVLGKLNSDRCKRIAREKGISLSRAGDFLVELGWQSYHLTDQVHREKLDHEEALARA